MNLQSARRSLALFLCAIMLLAMLPTHGAEAFPFAGYTTDSLRLRQEPSSTAMVLLTVPQGTELQITGAQGNYYITSYQGQLGYALETFITRAVPGATAAPLPVNIPADVAAKYPQMLIGSEGPQVKALQEALQELDFYKIAADSKYGSGTATAVNAFQEKNKLPQNGIADSLTQQKVFEGRPLNAAGRATTVRTLPAVAGLTLRPDAQGDAVRELQQKLRDLGFYRGTVDGIYGQGTQTAVRAFQKDKGLRVDGKAGPDTLAALNAPAGTPVAASAVPTAQVTLSPAFVQATEAPATYPYSTVAFAAVNMRKKPSLSGARILTIPQGATIQVLETSGDYLKVTYREYTGYAMSDYIEVPERYLSGNTLSFDTAARVNYEALSVGATGDKVRSLQRALEELGFFNGKQDGSFGAATISALKAFQEKNKLRATGIALPELQQLIYEKRPRNAQGRLINLKLLPPIPGFPMQSGDMGDAVLVLHRALEQLGHYDGPMQDTYSAKTVSAVKAFQKAHSIKQTGKTDEFTMLAINTAIGASPTSAPVQPLPQPQPTGLTPDNVVVIRLNTQGLAVTQLQTRLAALGYYNITPDGVYTARDVAAVKAFQMRNNLLVDGVADLMTQQALYADTALPYDNADAPQSPATTQTLRITSVGEPVKALQSRLITLGYLRGTADGIFGTQTAQAVTAFQQRIKLKADGIAGQQTQVALYAANAPASQAVQTPSSEEDAAGTPLSTGSSSVQVKAMQQRLVELKYLTGGADGVFGPKTFLAVQAFQQNNKLTADGIAGKQTLAKLQDVRAVAAGGLSAPLPTPIPTPTNPSFTAPHASEVRMANWESETRARARAMPNIIIYDFMSGAHYNIKLFSVGRHADGEPPTREETATMEKALGYNNWEPRPVWVIFSDGRVYMASTHSHGHEVDHNGSNGLTGHICVHFPRTMDAAIATGPYAVSHQNAILAGWDLTQGMARQR